MKISLLFLVFLAGCSSQPPCRVHVMNTFSHGVICESTIYKIAGDKQ